MFGRSLFATSGFNNLTRTLTKSLSNIAPHWPKSTPQLTATDNFNMLSYLNPLPHLSKYNGPYKVGSTEFEIPVSEIGSSNTAPDPRVTTVKFRVFYPTVSSATAKKSIPWLPAPQKVWNQAYAQFMGMSERRASWVSSLPSLLSYATIPAVQNAELPNKSDSKPYPVVIFSHGLGGNCNTYSSLLGSMASCGVICVAPEHRDGSAPTSLIKSSRNMVQTTIAYEKVSHSPSVEVLNSRNAMLRVRLWELELVYAALDLMNDGKQFTNYADTVSETDKTTNFQNRLYLNPGKVTWAGHSFGSATTVQLVKSVYYHGDAPTPDKHTTDGQEWNMTPLFTPQSTSKIIDQINTDSPVALLDLWTMPLRGAPSRWLWEKPLPCYERKATSGSPNVISIISAEFYKWPEMRNRTRAVLSRNPDKSASMPEEVSPTPTSQQATSHPAEKELNEPVEPELVPAPSTSATEPQSVFPEDPSSNHTSEVSTRNASPAPSPSHNSTTSTPHSSVSSFTSTSEPAHLYLIPNSAHLSQSDFGPLFPNLTRYLMKALDPEKTMELNVRGILAMMRGCGLDVKELHSGKASVKEAEQRDRILDDGVVVDRWQRVKLTE